MMRIVSVPFFNLRNAYTTRSTRPPAEIPDASIVAPPRHVQDLPNRAPRDRRKSSPLPRMEHHAFRSSSGPCEYPRRTYLCIYANYLRWSIPNFVMWRVLWDGSYFGFSRPPNFGFFPHFRDALPPAPHHKTGSR